MSQEERQVDIALRDLRRSLRRFGPEISVAGRWQGIRDLGSASGRNEGRQPLALIGLGSAVLFVVAWALAKYLGAFSEELGRLAAKRVVETEGEKEALERTVVQLVVDIRSNVGVPRDPTLFHIGEKWAELGVSASSTAEAERIVGERLLELFRCLDQDDAGA